MLSAMAAACGDQAPPCPNEEDAESPDSGDGGGGPGLVRVIGTYTNASCPEVNPISIGPDSGGLVSLSATISGSAPDGSVLTYTWSAPTGSFTDPQSLETSYKCPGAGVITVSLTAAGGPCQNETVGLVMCQMVYSGP